MKQAAEIAEPDRGTLNNPPPGQDLPLRSNAYRDINTETRFTGNNILLKGFAVSCIGTDCESMPVQPGPAFRPAPVRARSSNAVRIPS